VRPTPARSRSWRTGPIGYDAGVALLALLLSPIASSAATAPSCGSYYASAAAWAWNATWLFGGDKLAWGVSVALASGVITALIVRKLKGNWFPSLIGGMCGTVGGALLVLLVVFLFYFARYPVIHEAKLLSRPHSFGTGSTFTIFDALQRANLKVQGGWNIIFTGSSDESAQVQGNLTTILQRALGEREVHFLEWPVNSVNLDAPRFPEPSDLPGITIYGSNPLAQALLGVLQGCFPTKITKKTVDGLEQFLGLQNLVVIEFGKGSPWSTDLACSG
jgi:hypothetical protein